MGKNSSKKKAVLENHKTLRRRKEEIDVAEEVREKERERERERTELCVRSSHKMMSSSKTLSLIYSKLE